MGDTLKNIIEKNTNVKSRKKDEEGWEDLSQNQRFNDPFYKDRGKPIKEPKKGRKI